MKFSHVLRLIWRNADPMDRVQITFYTVSMVFVLVGFVVDWPLWTYLVLYAGIVANVAWSYREFRKARKAFQARLAEYQRHAEIEYFEWLHDASPDD